jgi:hypothetical protein
LIRRLGFNYTIGAGITLETSYPYTGTDSKCSASKIKPVATIKGYVRLPTNNYTALMNAVANLGPIAISAAAEPWQLYESGVYHGNCGAGTPSAPPQSHLISPALQRRTALRECHICAHICVVNDPCPVPRCMPLHLMFRRRPRHPARRLRRRLQRHRRRRRQARRKPCLLAGPPGPAPR